MSELIDISTLDRADVLAALYNASKPQGMGFLQATSEDMNSDEARNLLKDQHYFDYLKGRVMKVDLGSNADDGFNPRLYDRDNGAGAALRALRVLATER